MKADKYRFDGARTCDLRALSCDGKTDKDEIPAKTAENLQKMAALEAER